MEQLLQKQKTEVDELKRLLQNYRKDGSDRKTPKYLADKTKTFGEYFVLLRKMTK